MQVITLIKRTFQVVAGLILLGMMGFGFLTSYIDANPPSKERLEAFERTASNRVDSDSGLFEKLGVLVSTWWESDDLVAEIREEKALEAKAKADRRKAAESARFNSGSSSYDEDYYPSRE